MRYLIHSAIVATVIIGCSERQSIQLVSNEGAIAESVYLTNDQHDNPVVVWTERKDSALTLYFAVSGDNGKSFSDRAKISLAPDVATHPEGMPKVAFKKDGTIIAAYEKKAPTNENKYASAIYYVASNDNGKSWTRESFLHSDTIPGRSRSYFDIERLPDGEIGASWLDIELNDETGGRSVLFAKTAGLKFSNEILIDSSACQCCRIDVYGDVAGRINIAYRGLVKGNMGQSIRDMMLATSSDKGRSFTAPIRISQDNWAVDGCPHTGPSLCSTKSGLFSFWYTEGNGMGIYYSFKQNGDQSFGQRQLISSFGRHPQSSADEQRFAMVWEEHNDQSEHKFTNVLYQVSRGAEVKKDYLTPRDSNAYLPGITQTANGFLVAFLMEVENGVGVYTAKL